MCFTRRVRGLGWMAGMLGLWAATAATAAEPLCCGADLEYAAAPTTPARPIDVRAKLHAMQFKPGLNLIDDSGGLRLYARYDGGRIVDYVILDAHGKRVQVTTSRRAAANGGTTCWKCGKAEDGSLHCWIVPCPVIRDSVTTGTVR